MKDASLFDLAFDLSLERSRTWPSLQGRFRIWSFIGRCFALFFRIWPFPLQGRCGNWFAVIRNVSLLIFHWKKGVAYISFEERFRIWSLSLQGRCRMWSFYFFTFKGWYRIWSFYCKFNGVGQFLLIRTSFRNFLLINFSDSGTLWGEDQGQLPKPLFGTKHAADPYEPVLACDLIRWALTIQHVQCVLMPQLSTAMFDFRRIQLTEQQSEKQKKNILQKCMVFSRRARELQLEDSSIMISFVSSSLPFFA